MGGLSMVNGFRLSSVEAAEQLAPVCYGVLTRRLTVQFPTSSRSAPSPFVRVIGGDGSVVAELTGAQWNGGVVPVLLQDQFLPTNLATWSLPESQVLQMLSGALGESFRAAGYGPYPA